MRQRGNFRLLLNANLWPQMPVSMMDGNKVSCTEASAKCCRLHMQSGAVTCFAVHNVQKGLLPNLYYAFYTNLCNASSHDV